jgi:hypothetical protein
VMWVMWNLTSFRLETVLLSVQDRCMIWVRCTKGSKIILDTPNGTTRCEARSKPVLVCLEIVLMLMQDSCTVCVERAIGSEIVLDTPDGTPL